MTNVIDLFPASDNLDAPFDWASLESHVTADGTFNPPTRTAKGIDAKVVKFPCTPCRGTGKYQGARVHQPKSNCFACNGRGFFLTSERDRMNARQTRATSKARNLAETREAFEAANPGVTAYLTDAARWSSFAADVLVKLTQYGSVSDNTVAALRRMQAKAAATQDARKVERSAGNATVDLAPIRAMFETAVTNGHKSPIYRACVFPYINPDLIISRAPDHGKNPGALYVKTSTDDYLGKIIGTQYTGKPAPALVAIAANPRGEAVRYGMRTGTCSCCGRTLTNAESIKLGIGPICASRWGL